MKSVKEVSLLTGVSVRTLHHYDAIGLLKPTCVTDAGYRLYNEAAIGKLQTILLFKELEFPLKDIRDILAAPDFDFSKAITQQIRLLELKRDQLDKLIDHARQIKQKGAINMDFSAFDKSKMEEYTAKAKAQWGHTDAYKEFETKTKGQTEDQLAASGDALMDIFAKFGAIRTGDPAGEEAQALVSELQNFITEHYYTCTLQILRSLGQMYTAGGSMTDNIDKSGGKGTAEFAAKAIEIFCK